MTRNKHSEINVGKSPSIAEFYLLGFPGSQAFCLLSYLYLLPLLLSDRNGKPRHDDRVDKHLPSPVHFLLGHLSVLEIVITSIAVPLMLWNLLLPRMQAVSLAACGAQLYLYLSLGTSELVLMGAMAVDCYVPVCHPLRYNFIMNSHTCSWVLSVSWLLGSYFKSGQSVPRFSLPSEGKCAGPFLL